MANVDPAGEEYAHRLLEIVASTRQAMRDVGDLLADNVIGDAEWWKDWKEETASMQTTLTRLRELQPHREWRLAQERHLLGVQELVAALTTVSSHEHDLKEEHLRDAFNRLVASTRHLEAAVALEPPPRIQN